MPPHRHRRFVRRALAVTALSAAAIGTGAGPVWAQGVDCARLQQLIARGGGRYASNGALRRQSAEIGRTRAMLRQYGCEQFSFFGGSPACGDLGRRLQGLEAGLAQLQSSGGTNPALIARYNASCRGGQGAAPPPSRAKGFFESLFGGGNERREPLPQLPPDPKPRSDDEDNHGRSGSQAVCVRTCDGGFFPLGISARSGKEDLTEMCHALCPGTETAVFTRSPNADIKTAAGLDGTPYVDMPNALKFEKSFVATCSCRQAGKSWAETLANAEEVLDSTRKGDIVVTKDKSDELSRPKLDPRATAAALAKKPDDAVVADAPAPATTGGIRRVGPRN